MLRRTVPRFTGSGGGATRRRKEIGLCKQGDQKDRSDDHRDIRNSIKIDAEFARHRRTTSQLLDLRPKLSLYLTKLPSWRQLLEVKLYSTCIFTETGQPSFSAGSNRIRSACLIDASVRPSGNP